MAWTTKKNSAVVASLPVPQTVHNHPPNRAGEYFALAAIGVGLCIAIFAALCALVALMGIDEPARVVATGVVFVGVGGGLLWIAAWGVSAIFSKVLDFLTQLNRDTWDGKARVAQVELLAAQTTATSSRALDYQDSKAMLALEILQEAYNHKGDYGNGEKRPWLGDNPNGIAKEKNITIKHLEARRMGVWLLNHGLITEDDQINRARFSDYKDAMRYIQSMYALPIQVNNHPAPYQE